MGRKFFFLLLFHCINDFSERIENDFIIIIKLFSVDDIKRGRE